MSLLPILGLITLYEIMKAIVYTKYGSPDQLQLKEVETPIPKETEVLIRVHAASINDWDWGLLQGKPFVNRVVPTAAGLFKPTCPILGSDIAGRIEAVGKSVARFRVGDEVFGDLSGSGWGGFAEYVCAREDSLERKSPHMTFVQAAAIPQAAMLALQGLQKGSLRSGQKLLLNGAGGGVGTFALQIAKLQDVEVTGVDSARKLDMLSAMGADHVVDYIQGDFTKSGRTYDLILDVKTNRSPFDYAHALRPNGIYATVGGSMTRLLQALILGPWISLVARKKISVVALKQNRDLAYMNELFEAGKVIPVIDGPYTLSDVPEAMRHFGRGDHKGKVVISVVPEPATGAR